MKGKIKNMEWNFQPETGSLTVRGRSREEDGKNGSNHSFHDTGGKSQSGYPFSIQKAQNCQRCRGGHQRSEPYDQAVQRDEKTDETIWQAGKEEEIRISVLNMIYREFRVI